MTNRKSAISKVRRISKEAGVGREPVRTPSGVHPVLGSLQAIENRARLSLECYRYTQDPYWLTCAFDDCEKGGLDWNSLCEGALGAALPPPTRPAASEVRPVTRPSATGRE